MSNELPTIISWFPFKLRSGKDFRSPLTLFASIYFCSEFGSQIILDSHTLDFKLPRVGSVLPSPPAGATAQNLRLRHTS